MKNILIDLSGKINKTSVSILKEIEEVSTRMHIPFFIVGATARDIILEHQFDISPGRATIDIDIAVLIDRWDKFETLKDRLVHSGKFRLSRQKQRLIYDDHFPVDIIPFGMIANEDGSITWPPDHEIRMSTTGFQECFQHAVSVKLSSNPSTKTKLIEILKRENNSKQGHKIALDILQSDVFRSESYVVSLNISTHY